MFCQSCLSLPLECFLFCPISVLESLGSGSEKPASGHRLTTTSPVTRCPRARPDCLLIVSAHLILSLLLMLLLLPWIL